MDAWALFLRRAFNVASLNFCFLGRWLLHMPSGVFRHSSISSAGQKPRECVVGWLAHYTIGITLAIAFLVIVSPAWLARPTLLPALLWGAITVAMPFLVLQPSLGLGIASSKAPNPARARMRSMATHLVYGGGLYFTASILALAMR